MHYVACSVNSGVAHVAGEEELAEVAWVAHGEIPAYAPYGLFEPVQEYFDGEPAAAEWTGAAQGSLAPSWDGAFSVSAGCGCWPVVDDDAGDVGSCSAAGSACLPPCGRADPSTETAGHRP